MTRTRKPYVPRVPKLAREYLAKLDVWSRPHIAQEYERGLWHEAEDRGEVTMARLRQLRSRGVEAVCIMADGHRVDFNVADLIAGRYLWPGGRRCRRR